MLSKKELQQRKNNGNKITKEEVHELIEGFDVLIMDICDACGVSKPTMDVYLGQNTQPLPKKHKKTLIDFFLEKYKNGTPPKNGKDPDIVEYNRDVDGEPNTPEGMPGILGIEGTNETFTVTFESIGQSPKEEHKMPYVNMKNPHPDFDIEEEYQNLYLILESPVQCNYCGRPTYKLYPHPDSSYPNQEFVCESCREEEKAPEDFGIKVTPDEEEQDDIDPDTKQKLEKKFKHLAFEKVVFRPRNGELGEALLEALKYSRKVGIPVHVRDGEKLIKICEQ